MKLLMIDNYDSFTYNVVQYFGELGCEPTVYRNDEISIEEVRSQSPDGLVLSPGPGRPSRAGILNELVRSMAGSLPILGICLGHQAIAEVFGGKITYAPTLMHGKTSEILHDGSKLYESINSPFIATRYHSLTVDPESLPKILRRTAWTVDNVIMGIEHESLPIYGLQFHPESIMTPDGKQLLKNFLNMM